MKLWLVCDVCHMPGQCGPGGEGYSILVPSKDLRKYAPLLKVALQLFKASAATARLAGYPVPAPHMDVLSELDDLASKLLDKDLQQAFDEVSGPSEGQAKR
jgi:hypothetical protein